MKVIAKAPTSPLPPIPYRKGGRKEGITLHATLNIPFFILPTLPSERKEHNRNPCCNAENRSGEVPRFKSETEICSLRDADRIHDEESDPIANGRADCSAQSPV